METSPDDELTSRSTDPVLLGEVVDERYALRRVLGRGAAAVVYAAEHLRVRRMVALKLPLHAQEARELLRARLRREIDALGRVRHNAIVDALDAGEHQGMPYLVMELLEGRTLAGLIAARGRLGADETIKIGVALAEGLAAVHAAGLVHRDMKPLNVLLTHAPWRQVHLCDFGLATLQGQAEAAGARLTARGMVVGTVEYMSLEAFTEDQADPRNDLYALGVTLFECLTGAVPVEGSLAKLLARLTAGPLPEVRSLRADVPPALSAVVARCVAPVDQRYASARELADALRAVATTDLPALDLLRGGVRPQTAQAAPATDEPSTRRNHARAPFVALVSLQRGNEQPQSSRVEDVSRGGLLVFGKLAYTAGDTLRVRFALPISGLVITVPATVRWSRAARHGVATGLEFGEVPESAAEEIDRYVELMGRPG